MIRQLIWCWTSPRGYCGLKQTHKVHLRISPTLGPFVCRGTAYTYNKVKKTIKGGNGESYNMDRSQAK